MKDLFEHYYELPSNVLNVIEGLDDALSYKDCEALVKELNKLGYTCEYGLDAVPYNLQKL